MEKSPEKEEIMGKGTIDEQPSDLKLSVNVEVDGNKDEDEEEEEEQSQQPRQNPSAELEDVKDNDDDNHGGDNQVANSEIIDDDDDEEDDDEDESEQPPQKRQKASTQLEVEDPWIFKMRRKRQKRSTQLEDGGKDRVFALAKSKRVRTALSENTEDQRLRILPPDLTAKDLPADPDGPTSLRMERFKIKPRDFMSTTTKK